MRGDLLHIRISKSIALDLSCISSSLRTRLRMDCAKRSGNVSGQMFNQALINLKHYWRSLATALLLNSRSRMNTIKTGIFVSASCSLIAGLILNSILIARILFSRIARSTCRISKIALSSYSASLMRGWKTAIVADRMTFMTFSANFSTLQRRLTVCSRVIKFGR